MINQQWAVCPICKGDKKYVIVINNKEILVCAGNCAEGIPDED